VLQAWNFILVIAAFSLTILGTFLTRSGVIASVHSFTQSAIGPVLLWFLMFVLVASLGLFAARIHRVASSPRLDSLASREGVFLINNLLLTLFAVVVLIGTLYPMVYEALRGAQIGVGRPFFDRIAVPISLALIVAMAIGPLTPYRAARPRVVWERLRNPLRFALAVAALVVLLGHRTGWVVLTVLLGSFVIALAARLLWATARVSAAKRSSGVLPEMIRTMRRDPPFWGGQIAHIGIVVLAIGIGVSANLSVHTTIEMEPGETREFAGFDLTYTAPFTSNEPNRAVQGALVELRRGNDLLSTMRPRINQYPPPRQQAVPSPFVDTGLRGDLYASLTRIDSSGITLDLFWFPFIWLIWAGGAIASLGGAWAWLARTPRRKAAVSEEEAAAHV
jgi:cytochrome c-type biogenesis protein CcmF